MDADKYRRSVSLSCPTCGSTEFDIPDDGTQPVTCSRCERTIMRDELVRENSENISAHVEEVKSEIVRDLKDSLRKAFRGNKNFRIK